MAALSRSTRCASEQQAAPARSPAASCCLGIPGHGPTIRSVPHVRTPTLPPPVSYTDSNSSCFLVSTLTNIRMPGSGSGSSAAAPAFHLGCNESCSLAASHFPSWELGEGKEQEDSYLFKNTLYCLMASVTSPLHSCARTGATDSCCTVSTTKMQNTVLGCRRNRRPVALLAVPPGARSGCCPWTKTCLHHRAPPPRAPRPGP